MFEQLSSIYGTGKAFIMALHEGSMAMVLFLSQMFHVAIPADLMTIIAMGSLILLVALVIKFVFGALFKHALIIGSIIIVVAMFFPIPQG